MKSIILFAFVTLLVSCPATDLEAQSWEANGEDIYNTNTGNIGVGTSTPVCRLTVQTDPGKAGFTHIAGNNAIIVEEHIGQSSASLGTTTNNAFRLKAAGNGLLHLYPTGEVVVGSNNSPAFGKFTVATAVNSYGVSHISDNGTILATRVGGTSAGIGTFSNADMRIFCNSASAIFVSAANRNVGIGLADDDRAPLYKLDVGSSIRIRSAPGQAAGVWLNDPNNNAVIAFMGVADNVSAGFFAKVPGWGLIMNINTGNVGIGTLNPTYKLSVNGDVRAKEIVVETGWADYVFDKKYKLLPLDQLEKFIRQNNHLPNIPSAQEVEKNGLQLGDLQRRMMEKIEELTLYVIELKKEIEILKSNADK